MNLIAPLSWDEATCNSWNSSYHVDNISRVLYIVCALFDFCNFSQCPAGGGRVRYQEKGKASAELSEILPRLQAAQGVGAPHPRVTAPTGRRLPGTSCGKSAHSSTYTCGGTGTLCRALCVVNHGIVLKTVFFLLQHMLSKVGTWNFDIFLFDRLTNGKMTLLDVVVPDLFSPSQYSYYTRCVL